jgi:uncharacterized protein (UPF0332 family)
MEAARERLAAAAELTPEQHANPIVSLAYYAMVYAASAALSERERHSRTHGGTWHLMRETFVASGELPVDLIAAAQKTQQMREGGDYAARHTTTAEAQEALAVARRFVSAIETLIGA